MEDFLNKKNVALIEAFYPGMEGLETEKKPPRNLINTKKSEYMMSVFWPYPNITNGYILLKKTSPSLKKKTDLTPATWKVFW